MTLWDSFIPSMKSQNWIFWMVQGYSSRTSLIVMNLHLPKVPKKWQKLELAFWLNAMNMEDFEHFKNFVCMVLILLSTLNLKIWIFFLTPMCEYDINFVLSARPYYFITCQIEEFFFPLRVNPPITDHMPMTEHFYRSFSILLHFEWCKML